MKRFIFTLLSLVLSFSMLIPLSAYRNSTVITSNGKYKNIDAFSKELKNTDSYLKSFSRDIESLQRTNNSAKEMVAKGQDMINKLGNIDRKLGTMISVMNTLVSVPRVGHVVRVLRGSLKKSKRKIHAVYLKLDKFKRKVLDPAMRKLETFDRHLNNAVQSVKGWNYKIGKVRSFMGLTLRREKNSPSLASILKKFDQEARPAVNTLQKVNSVLNMVKRSSYGIKRKLYDFRNTTRGIERARHDVEKFIRKFHAAEKITGTLNHVLNKRRRFLRKRFTIKGLLTRGMPRFFRRVKRKIDRIIDRALRPITKRIRVRLPSIRAVERFQRDLGKIEQKAFVLKNIAGSIFTDIRNIHSNLLNTFQSKSLNFSSSLKGKDLSIIPSNRYFNIQSVMNYGRNPGGCWDVPGNRLRFKNGQNIHSWDLADNEGDRQFKFQHVGGNYYIILPRYGRNRAAISVDHKNRNGSNVYVAYNNRSRNVKFRMRHMGGGKYKIYSLAHRNKVVCLNARTSRNGSNIHLWDDHNGPWMEWVLIDAYSKKTFVPGRY